MSPVTPAPITRKVRNSFIALGAAFAEHRLCVARCEDLRSGQPAHVICAIDQQDGVTTYTPLARLFNGNPLNEITPPGVAARKLI